MDFFQELERERSFYRFLMFFYIVLEISGFVLLFYRQWFWGIFIAVSGSCGVGAIDETLRNLWREFCGHRILPIAKRIFSEGLTDQVGIPKYRRFLWARDFREFEDRELKFLRSFRKTQSISKNKIRELDEFQAWLDTEEAKRLDIVETHLERKDLSAGELFKNWRFIRNLARKSGILSGVEAISEAGHDLVNSAHNRKITRIRKRFDYLSNISDTSNGLCSEARELVEKAELAELSQKESILEIAIKAQKEVINQGLDQGQDKTGKSVSKSAIDVHYQTLSNFVEGNLNLENLLPDSIDKEMAKQILLVLIDPGRNVNIFESNYRPEDAIKRTVVKSYRRLGLFSPKAFEITLKWLGGEGIIVSKTKTDERVYALSSKPANARSEKSKELIKAIIAFSIKKTTPGV